MRAIREGIHRDGRALFPMMPYVSFRRLADEDARALVVYLRSLPPRSHQVKPPDVDFPVSLLMRVAPQPVDGPVTAPDPAADPVGYGRYLVNLAQCSGCHTPMDGRGQPIEELAFAGGREFLIPMPDGRRSRSVTANITPDPETGYFGSVTKDGWIARVRAFAAMKAAPPEAPWGTATMMPWLEYAGLTDRDLGAIYDFMKTVKPVRRHVNRFPDAARATP
jgi:mono/diheme cytochrome c family protein